MGVRSSDRALDTGNTNQRLFGCLLDCFSSIRDLNSYRQTIDTYALFAREELYFQLFRWRAARGFVQRYPADKGGSGTPKWNWKL